MIKIVKFAIQAHGSMCGIIIFQVLYIGSHHDYGYGGLINDNMKCDKKAFTNLDDARQRLTEIVLNSDRDNKPIRTYKCKYCNRYHLTSKSESKYKSNVKKKHKAIKERNTKRENDFIRMESEYWEQKFGIE